jgi:hypothetical protein
MATQPNVDTECLLLGEFVDNARAGKSNTAAATGSAAALREAVRLMAVKTGVPRFKIDEVVERVFAAVGPEIENHVRQQIRAVLREYGPDPTSKPDEKPRQESQTDRASTL